MVGTIGAIVIVTGDHDLEATRDHEAHTNVGKTAIHHQSHHLHHHRKHRKQLTRFLHRTKKDETNNNI